MPKVIYRASGFPKSAGSALTGQYPVGISWNQLVWSAITMGKPGTASLLAHGWHSLSDIIVRAFTVYAHLRQQSNQFQKSALYDSLDPTEKGAVSYFIGMLAAKIVGTRLLDTRHLFHLSMFSSMGGSVDLIGGSAPDLIGTNSKGGWVVVEAKGRTNGFSSGAMAAAKNQTRQVRQINGQLPQIRVATQAYFCPYLRVNIEDPEQYEENAKDIEVERDLALGRYYDFILEFTKFPDETMEVFGGTFDFRHIEEVGISIGLDRSVRPALATQSNLIDVSTVWQGFATGRIDENSLEALGDGIAIRLDSRWSAENMAHEPPFRLRI